MMILVLESFANIAIPFLLPVQQLHMRVHVQVGRRCRAESVEEERVHTHTLALAYTNDDGSGYGHGCSDIPRQGSTVTSTSLFLSLMRAGVGCFRRGLHGTKCERKI